MYICFMEKDKPRFIQLEFYTEYDIPSDYVVIVEVLNDVPINAFIVKVPERYTFFPRFPFIKN